MPKTELHEHLGGGTPIALLRKLAAEKGTSPAEIDRMVGLIKPTRQKYRDLGEFLVAYGGLAHANIVTPSDYRRAAESIVKQAGRENVHYLELRELVDHNTVGAPRKTVEAIEQGLRDGAEWVKRERGYKIGTGFIVAAVRNFSPKETLGSAKLAVQMAKRPDSLVRGFDLAGGESDHPVTEHASAIRYVARQGKPLGLKITVHAGGTPTSGKLSGLGSIEAALDLGADRIGHASQLGEELRKDRRTPEAVRLAKRMVRDKIHLELNPISNFKIGDGVERLGDYPLRDLVGAGLSVSLSTDDPTFFTRSAQPRRQQLYQLWKSGLLTDWRSIKELMLDGVRAGFAPPVERAQIERQMRKEFARIERDPIHGKTIAKYFTAT